MSYTRDRTRIKRRLVGFNGRGCDAGIMLPVGARNSIEFPAEEPGSREDAEDGALILWRWAM
ncbi:hypothetical protein [Acidiphilium sp.]|uniref:hypothetical protein n=1 Tax=Acidiphilium sp. TaxID=527 RepID=UPI003D058005